LLPKSGRGIEKERLKILNESRWGVKGVLMMKGGERIFVVSSDSG